MAKMDELKDLVKMLEMKIARQQARIGMRVI
jgi:hypothetical protein